MSDFRRAKMRGHRRNIERYCRLLATELTDLERQYLHKRIAEEQAQLERLEKSQQEQQAEVIAAAEAQGKRTGGQSHV
jgi:bacterioferritin (cytochrome b1)